MQKTKTEIQIEDIKIDNIDARFVTEYKKKRSELKAIKMQLLYYLYVLNKHGVHRKGKICFKESTKTFYVELDKSSKSLIEKVVRRVNELLSSSSSPSPQRTVKCTNCAYFEYCFS